MKVGKTLISEENIQQRLGEMGAEITADYEGKDLLLVAVLKGAFMVMADLARKIALPVDIDFMAVSSYGAATQTSGVVRILKDLDQEIAGRDVLIVEDIIDSGMSIHEVQRYIRQRGATEVKVATLLDKPATRKMPFQADYIGFTIEPAFVVGYGLDYAEKYRNLPEVAILEE